MKNEKKKELTASAKLEQAFSEGTPAVFIRGYQDEQGRTTLIDHLAMITKVHKDDVLKADNQVDLVYITTKGKPETAQFVKQETSEKLTHRWKLR